jgi:hypothetical protein
MKIDRLRRGRTVAVIGSIAVIGGGATAIAATRSGDHVKTNGTGHAATAPAGPSGRKPLASLTTGELSALARARAAIATAAASIATPILERAVGAGTITAAQRTAFLASLSATPGSGSGPDGTWTGATGATGATGGSPGDAASAAAQAVYASVQKAIQAQLRSIATPVLDAAVTAGTISSAQETALLALLAHGPLAHAGPGGGPRGGGPGPGGPGGGAPGGPSA